MTRSPTGRRVYIAGLARHDYEPAKDYGDLVVVVSGQLDLSDVDAMRDIVTKALNRSEPDDYIILSGAPILGVLCVMEMLRRHGCVNVLQWNGVLRDYEALELGGVA